MSISRDWLIENAQELLDECITLQTDDSKYSDFAKKFNIFDNKCNEWLKTAKEHCQNLTSSQQKILSKMEPVSFPEIQILNEQIYIECKQDLVWWQKRFQNIINLSKPSGKPVVGTGNPYLVLF